MSHHDPKQDLVVRVISNAESGNKGQNRLIAYRDGSPVFMDTGELNNQVEDYAGTLKALYLAIERIAELEDNNRALLDDNTWAWQQLNMQRRAAAKQRLDTHEFGEGITLESVNPLYDGDSDLWAIPVQLKHQGNLADAFLEVLFQPGSASVMESCIKWTTQ